MPLFSILIPTRNRSDLLKCAIQSVLQQNCDDYEIILSDNDSSDDTYKAVLGFNSQKIRYINTGEYLSSSASWNFAYTQAAGDYVLILGDDDYLAPDALRWVRNVIKEKSAPMISWGLITYYDNTYNDVTCRNTIHTRRFTGNIIELDAREVLRAYFGLYSPSAAYPPHPSAVCISRHIAEQISSKHGAFYAPPYADITAISRSLAYSNSLILIDKPLVIVGRTSRSSVAKFSQNIKSIWQEHPGELSMSIFKGKYTYNLHTESLLVVKHSDPERFKDYDINLERYCCLYYQDMTNASRGGYDIGLDLREFNRKLLSLPPNVQRNIRRYIRKARAKEFLRKSPLWKIAPIRVLKRRVNVSLRKAKTIEVIRGDSVGVYDIASCANHLVEIAQALKQPIDVWDPRKAPILNEVLNVLEDDRI